MTQVLASINSVHEAHLLLSTAVHIIDLKQPAEGALGALSLPVIDEIVTVINQQKPISATIGDLPMQPEPVFNAVQTLAKTGVDYIKIGFFPSDNWQAVIHKLKSIATNKPLIAVLFADSNPDLSVMQDLKTAGFAGIMLDTMDKSQGSLTQVMDFDTIQQFVSDARQIGLICGLAGSLKCEDIPLLLPLKADYLGFRGALCQQHLRTAELNVNAVASVLGCF